MGVVLKHHGVIPAIEEVIIGLGLLQVPVQPYAGMGEHGGLHRLAMAGAKAGHPGGHIVDKGVAIADEQDFHSPFPSFWASSSSPGIFTARPLNSTPSPAGMSRYFWPSMTRVCTRGE